MAAVLVAGEAVEADAVALVLVPVTLELFTAALDVPSAEHTIISPPALSFNTHAS